jgi:hypothetical protein
MTLSQEEYKARVLFAMLAPAARLAVRFRTSLREMKHLIELSIYREARRRGLKMKEVQALLSISMSKVGLLSKDLKEHFAAPDQAHGLPRRLLSLLWAGPLSEARLLQALEGQHEASDILAALAQMVADKRLSLTQERTPRYQLGEPQYRLVQEPWMARVDALGDLMEVVVRTVEARFFEGDERAMARSLNFRVKPEDLPRLKQLYEEQIFPLICEMDAAVSPEAASIPLSFSILWTPQAEEPEPGADAEEAE